MQTSKEGLESELNQELLTTLSSRDQDEVDTLNDDIRRLKTENKKAFAERMRLEAQKNKLENLLTNNLNRRKDELVQALQEISVEDRKRQLENASSELSDLEKRIEVSFKTYVWARNIWKLQNSESREHYFHFPPLQELKL